MEEPLTIPFCAPAPSDTIPMLVVAAVFLLLGWLFHRWRKKRRAKNRNS